MEAEKIVLPNGSSASLAANHTLTDTKDAQVKLVPVPAPATTVVVFVIGGAGDKRSFLATGPNHNVRPIRNNLLELVPRLLTHDQLPNFSAKYRGYYEAHGDDEIQTHFIDHIPSKRSIVYLVGHSLGGWNAAHLSSTLSEKGYTVKMLVTLDPVGERFALEVTSSIYIATPKPKATRWINVYARPSSRNFTDVVAWAGSKWEIESGPEINTSIDTNHAEAPTLMNTPLSEGKSAYQLLVDDVLQEFSK